MEAGSVRQLIAVKCSAAARPKQCCSAVLEARAGV